MPLALKPPCSPQIERHPWVFPKERFARALQLRLCLFSLLALF